MSNIYYGTKKIIANAMTRLEYNVYRGWDLPGDEDGNDAGFLVEYVDGGASNHPEHEGYISWSPKDVFEGAYQPVTALSFGHAIQALKEGRKVARAGWNGKDMWLSMSGGAQGHTVGHDLFWSKNNAEYAKTQPNGQAKVLPSITMKTATGEILMGWLASQTDMLADDWIVVD